ncbi:MAG: sigma-70 family RNA polymerase sigma factor [Actinomycetota bacterium]|nr:sigma-70 family RNA polymerase sigma factor [Actinomycetota bacterium]
MTDSPVLTWEDVAHRYGRKIYTFAYRLTGNPDDAADLVQDVFLRVRKGLASYTPGSFDGWLWRITRNAFLDGVRKQQRRPTSLLPEGDHSLLGASPSPDEVLAAVRLSDDVQAALLKLPYDFREAVVLCDVVGLTYTEIADATEVPVGTVRSRIHRGRSMLRGLLTWPV